MAASTTYSSAKDLLDKIGQKVHDEIVKNGEAENYVGDLKGLLSLASTNSELSSSPNPCTFEYDKLINGSGSGSGVAARGKRYPCGTRREEVKRFSDKQGAQCDKKKIKDSDSNGDACAPFRRLNLCNKNLETISNYDSNARHKLLAEVCMAAKYEGDSIKTPYTIHQEKYGDSASQLCTVLARSFADIGDIIRGKDLYRGNDKEKEKRDKLDENLQKIFENIKKENNEKLKSLTDDQIREYWWYANRATIWEAITCDVVSGKYFRPTCSDSGDRQGPSVAQKQCRCPNGNDQVPTYFDYVPQYLRWFEEWAEDFCRKKKKYVDIVKTYCRGRDKDGNKRYCSRNGYDCEKTVRARGKLRMGKQCISCLYACNPYVDWINNQKEQFDKQVKKYQTEIEKYTNGGGGSGGGRQKRAARGGSDHKGYEKIFYEKLEESGYGTVKDFLKKLSNEDVCKRVEDDKGGTIHFENVKSSSASDTSGTNVESQGTFYRSKYCQPCPLCGVKKKDTGKEWEPKQEDEKCKSGNLYRPNKDAEGTPINFLYSGDRQAEIETKLNKFCAQTKNSSDGGGVNSDNQELYQKWKCYQFKQLRKVGPDDEDDDDYDQLVNNSGGLCILENKNKKEKGKEKKSEKEPDQFQKTFYDFFYYWVAHMLKDSIHWKKKLEKCLKNEKKKCGKKICNGDCDCFQNWIKQKKEKEWGQIKVHFNTQDGFGNQGQFLGQFGYDVVLEGVLDKKELLKIIEGTYGNTEETEHIKELLDEEKKREEEDEKAGETDNKNKNTIDWLIQHEEDEADLCLEIHEDEEEGDENDECDDDHEETQIVRSNPCATPSGSRHRALANEAAHQMHKAAKTQLSSRGGRRTLKANASKGEYRKGGKADELKDVCKITNQYSNARNDESKNPCNGKGVRFKIEEVWKNARENGKVIGVYLPPRRQHICTSNVEHLLPPKGGRFKEVPDDKASDSFLGDVLVAAKKEAEYIKNNYNEGNNGQNKGKTGLNNEKTVCRAMKNSFADIGDIIRGRDMWEHSDQTQLQKDLVTIFGHIHSSLNGKGKYDGDDAKHTKLRSDWWEANRRQVWKAMKCHTSGITCESDTTPYDDYIPQRLRWMTEWAEWYCKMQSQEYEKFWKECAICVNGTCTHVVGKGCGDCKKQCQEYEKNIKEWADQWKHIKEKYEELYLQAQTTVNNGKRTVFPGADPDYQLMVDFLTQLIRKSGGGKDGAGSSATGGTTTTQKTPYSTAAGYIHQEAPIVCDTQREFCEYKNGVARNTDGAKENKKYAFKHPPTDYKDKCECMENEEKTKKEETQPTVVDVCKTVEEALTTPGNLTQACQQKYGYPQRHWGWKCISDSGVTTTRSSGNDGATCIPPRRRRLYIQKLHDWANSDETTKSQSQETSESSQTSSGSEAPSQPNSVPSTSQSGDNKTASDNKLRDAFIESAAIETFFLWDRYKQEKKKEDEEKKEQDGIYTSHVGEEPQNQLASGTIPPPFLRQMFYTLGDYRDLCVGNTDIVVNASTEDQKTAMQKIKENIEKILPKNGGPHPPKPGNTTPESWWNNNAKHIWNGMICALTYKDSDEKTNDTQKIKKDEQVYEKFFGSPLPQPANPGTSTKGTLKNQYEYKNVKLDENSGTSPRTTSPSGDNTPTLNNPKLKDFVKLPPFFRWLHEWGSDFCDTRKRLLKDVKDNCRNSDNPGKRHCSGDGYDCKEIKPENYENISDLDCRDCYKQCRKYRKWIDIKFVEFHNQKNKYKEEKQKLSTSSNNGGDDDNKKFCQQIKNNSFDQFLTSLKHCKNNEGDGSDPKNKINFEEPLKTFGPLEYCKTCPFNGVTCNGSGRGRTGTNGCTEKNPNWKTVFEGISGNGGKSSTIEVEMIDRRGPFIKEYLNNLEQSKNSEKSFKDSYLFKSVRDQNWECKFENENKDVCQLKNFNENIDINQYTTFNVLIEHWLEDFLYGYYLLKKRKLIEQCTQNKEHICDEGCEGKYKCVKKWIDQKKEEWDQIKKHFNKQNRENAYDIVYTVESLLGNLIPLMDLVNDKGKITKLSHLDGSNGCNCTKNSKKENGNEDAVQCLLKNLGNEAKKCEEKHQTGEKPQENCVDTPTPLFDDYEEENEEENDKKVGHPTFCKIEEETNEAVDEEGECKASQSPAGPESSGTEGTNGENEDGKPKVDEDSVPKDEKENAGGEETPKALKPEEKAPAPEGTENQPPPPPPTKPANPPSGPQPPPPQLLDHPAVIPSLVTSTLAWSVGIGFAAFTYFFLKVLNIYINIYGCGYICVLCISMCGYIWIYIYIYMFMYMCFCICICGVCLDIYIWIYMYVFYIYLCI